MSNSVAWSPKPAARGLCQEDGGGCRRGGWLLGWPQPDEEQLSVSQGPGLGSKGLFQATFILTGLPQRELFPPKTQVAFIGVVCHRWALNGNDRKVPWAEHKLAQNRMHTVQDTGTRCVPKVVWAAQFPH